MAQRQNATKIDTRNARSKLKARNKPYFVQLERELHLGYRKGATGGSWVVRRYVGGGNYEIAKIGKADDKPDMVGALDFEEAKKQARAVAARLHREDLGLEPGEKIKSGPYTVADACRDYLREHVDKHSRSKTDIYRIIENDILPKLGRLEVVRLPRKRIRSWHNELANTPARLRSKKGAAPRYRDDDMDDKEVQRKRKDTANHKLTVLKAALNFAYRERDDIETDKGWKTVEPFEKVGRSRKRILDGEEAQRLINACDGALRNLVVAALYTGCRYGELVAFSVRDLHRDSGTLYIHDSKTGDPRHVFLSDEAVEFFKRISAGRDRDLPLLPKDDGTRWGRAHHHRAFKAALERAGIERSFAFHSLRHTFASQAIMNGAELIVVATQLGHEDSRMVERHYGHLAKKYVQDKIKAASPSYTVDASNVVPIGSGR